MSKLGDGSASRGVEEISGRELSWLKDAHDKFATAQEETTGAEPGKGLAWLVVIQVLVYYLCTSIISTVTYLGIFAYIYVKWVYPMSNTKESEDLDESVAEADQEPEWLLDQFFSYIQQNKTDKNSSPSEEAELNVPDVEDEPGWVVDRFLSYVQQHKASAEMDEVEDDQDSNDQQLDDSKESSVNGPESETLVFNSEVTVSVVSKVASSVTSITNTLSTDEVKDTTELDDDEDDFEMIDSDELN